MKRNEANPLASVKDGLSSSMMVVEDAGRPGIWQVGLPGKDYNAGANLNNPTVKDGWGWADVSSNYSLDGATADGRFSSKSTQTGTGSFTLTQVGREGINKTSDSEAYSFHTGGITVLMADGSVRFLSQNIAPQTLGALATRNCREPVGEF